MSNYEIDPSTISNLDQQETEFNNNRDLFTEQFGFDHECRCGQDYTDGNTTEVTACFVQLAYDALAACARMKETIEDLEAELNSPDDPTVEGDNEAGNIGDIEEADDTSTGTDGTDEHSEGLGTEGV